MKTSFSAKTLILTLAVFVIWGAIGWQFYTNFADIEQFSELSTESPIRKDSVAISNYALFLDYDDPFLGKRSVAITGRKPKQPASAEVKKTAPSISYPAIDVSKFSYRGSYFNKKLNTHLAVIIASGNELISKKGDMIDGLRLEVILPDSICLFQHDRPIWIRKDL